MNFSPEQNRPPLVLELTPLIDVVFLLLIFFMVSTSFVEQPSAMEVDLPTSSNTQVLSQSEDVGILLTGEGQILLDGQKVSWDQLEQKLRSEARADSATQVVLRADHDLEYQRLIDVMSLAHELGLTHFSLATEQGSPGGN